MNILLIPSWYPCAGSISGSFFRERAHLWADHGCIVTVAVAELSTRTYGRPQGISVENDGSITVYRYFKRNLTPFWEEGLARQQVPMIRTLYDRAFGGREAPDVIHLDSARCAKAAVALAKSQHIPLTYTEHYSGILNSRPGSFLNRSMCLARDNAAHIFYISQKMKRCIAPREEICSYLPNAVDFSTFRIAEKQGSFTFGALGSLRKIKGYDVLLHAFARLLKQEPRARLIIGGDGEEGPALRQLAATLGIDPFVKFKGAVDPSVRQNFFDDLSCFVCSSHTETFSIVTVEALASGVPVVATKCGGPEDLVNRENGLLVPDNDPDAMADAMLAVVRNISAYDPEKIRRDAYAIFDSERIAKKQISCFEAVCKNRK